MILIAPDKFKGTYTAEEMCRLMAKTIHIAAPSQQVITQPLSDGGEGFEAMVRSCSLYSGYELRESSKLVGFRSYPPSLPLIHRSSYPLGEGIRPGCPTLISVGGTAVSDGGAGFLQALGVKFFDHNGHLITTPLTPARLPEIGSADTCALKKYELSAAIDVHATLVGPGLCALDFARQKALPGENLDGLPAALERLHDVLGGESPFDGAGGGIGYALASVAGATCRSGSEIAVSVIEPLLDSGKISLVITGEGCVDRQTVNGGKLPDAVFHAASARGIPTLIVGGRIEVPDAYPLMSTLKNLESTLRKILGNCQL